MKCKKSTPENRREVNIKTPNILDEWNGYPKISSLSSAIEVSRQCLLL